jgi:hypothetical protein
MNPNQRALEILLLASLPVAGILGQWRLWTSDKLVYVPRRLYLPLGLGLLVFGGFLLHTVISMVDPNKTNVSLVDSLGTILLGFCILIALPLQAYFGPLCVCWSLAWSVYLWFEYQQLHYFPVLDLLFDTLFQGTPYWLSVVYKVAMLLYCALSSLVEGVFGIPDSN